MTSILPSPPSIINFELEKIIESKGGLFILEGNHSIKTIQMFETIKSVFNRLIINAEKELYKDKPRKISYGILSGTDLNAFAYASPSDEEIPFDFIGINVGTIFTLLDTFGRILSHPDNFPDIGDASLEDEERTYVPYLSTNVISTQNMSCFPNCPIRSIYASNLMITALKFLFYHEVTHLRNGHLEYVKEELSYSYWQEAVSTRSKKLEPLVHQALEMDADCGAILMTLNESFSLMRSSPRKGIDPKILAAIKFSYGDSKSATKTVLFSIYVLFRVFDFSEWDYFNQYKQTHPQPPMRMFWTSVTIYEIFFQRPEYEYNSKVYINDAVNIMLAAEIACGRIQNELPDLRGITSVITPNMRSIQIEYLRATCKFKSFQVTNFLF